MKSNELYYSPKSQKRNFVILILILCSVLFLNGCSESDQSTIEILDSNAGTVACYEDLTSSDIAFGQWEMSDAVIDASDGNDFKTGTYITYKTSKGRYGKFIVEGLDKSSNNKLTVGWVTYSNDGSVYSSGSGLEIRGTWNCDLDIGKESSKDRDFHWQMKTHSTRNLNPRNGAIFRLMHQSP